MNVNPLQLIRNGQNPQQLVMNMLEQSCQGNPMMMNLFNLAKQGNSSQIEQIARNLVASKGGNFDQEFAAFRQMMGL